MCNSIVRLQSIPPIWTRTARWRWFHTSDISLDDILFHTLDKSIWNDEKDCPLASSMRIKCTRDAWKGCWWQSFIATNFVYIHQLCSLGSRKQHSMYSVRHDQFWNALAQSFEIAHSNKHKNINDKRYLINTRSIRSLNCDTSFPDDTAIWLYPFQSVSRCYAFQWLSGGDLCRWCPIRSRPCADQKRRIRSLLEPILFV